MRSAVEAVLAELDEEAQQGWRAELARSLALTLDEQLATPGMSVVPSTARELRAVMAELEDDTGKEADALDQLAALAAEWAMDADGEVDTTADR